MKNKITLIALAVFILLLLSVVAIRKKMEQSNPYAGLQQLHPILAFTLVFSDLTKIHIAAIENDAEKTEKLIVEEDWAVDRPIKGKLTPLHAASMCGSIDSAEVLIRHGADVDYQSRQGITPLAYAAIGGKAEMVKLLLANGASADKKNEDGLTPDEVARQWVDEMSPQNNSYYQQYTKRTVECIEVLKKAADKPTGGDPNNMREQED